MLKTVDFYYFSPTGGTKKAGDVLASELARVVNKVNLAEKTINTPQSDVVVVAAPVFGGRIPAIVSDKIAKISKVYHDVININKQQRQSLWVEKCRLESATPVDVDAIADNRAEHNELKRQANVLTTQLDADITALKRNYSSKKAELAADESRQLLSVAEDIAQRRQNLINEIASLVQKGGDA